MGSSTTQFLWRIFFGGLALLLLGLLFIPIVGLIASSSPAAILAGVHHPLFLSALWLSLKTTWVSLLFIVLAGTPLAWWLARSSNRYAPWITLLVDLPIVIPPAVVGIALLYTFGRNGLLAPFLSFFHWQIPFTTAAVVLAQIVVASPFYIQSAVASFRRVDADLLLVAQTLGQSSMGAFFRVALPMALPGLIAGAALSWGRALGEFGATLLFAGNLSGKTQTMPLAIYMALESDVRAALALSLFLAGIGMLLLFGLRLIPFFSSRLQRPNVTSSRFGGDA